MEKVYKFKAELIKADKVDGAYVKFPFNVKDEFGTNGRVKVCASFDGEKYRGILAKMGEDCHIIGVTKAIRKKIQKETGDEIEVIIKEDNKSRQEEVPEIFESALNKNKLAKEFFDTLTESQKNKFIKFITSAKKEETKISRLEKTIEMLSKKEKIK